MNGWAFAKHTGHVFLTGAVSNRETGETANSKT